MASAGLIWISYLIIHMLANLQFFKSADAFNGFYAWFNNSVLYLPITILLILALLLHVAFASYRQLDSNQKRHIGYKKPYPKAVPRLVAWGGALLLLSFIIFHMIQMLSQSEDLHQALINIFANPLMWVLYALGLFALGAHLHHGLANIGQTFGLSHHQHYLFVWGFLILLIGGFISVPLSIILR